MSLNYIFSNFINTLNVCSRNHYDEYTLPYHPFYLPFLGILYKQGIIRGFYVEDSFIFLFFKYYLKNSILRFMSIISKPGKRIFWSLPKLYNEQNISSFTGFFIISTNRGYFTSYQCLCLKQISGEVLVKVDI